MFNYLVVEIITLYHNPEFHLGLFKLNPFGVFDNQLILKGLNIDSPE